MTRTPRRPFLLAPALLLSLATAVHAQDSGWSQPSDVITRVATAAPPASASLSPMGTFLVLETSEAMPGLDVVSRPHLKLAGMRIDGETWSRQLGTKVTGLTLQALPAGGVQSVDFEPGHFSRPIWAADEHAFALVRTEPGGATLSLVDPAVRVLRQVEGVRLNQVLGGAVQWMPDQRHLLVKVVVSTDAPTRPRVPDGPVVQQTRSGVQAQVRTYQDLLKNAHDADVLEHYATSQLVLVDTVDLSTRTIGAPAMYLRVDPSPDGTMLLVETIERPFSFVVPIYRFPRLTRVLDLAGEPVRELARNGLLESVPIGGVQTGPRGVTWMPTAQHALYWSEALDGGDPQRDAPHRDSVFLLAEPNGTPRLWFKTEYRSGGVQFDGDGAFALAREYDRKTRTERLWRHDLTKLGEPGVLVHERSTQDVYGDPGRAVGERLTDGRDVLRSRAGRLFLAGEGASAQGARPFLDAWDPVSGDKQRLFESAEGRHETFFGFVGPGSDTLLVRSEAKSEPPQLVYLDLLRGERRVLHTFEDPSAKWTKQIQQRLVRYEREDGVPMNGTLYLPPSYRDGDKLPCLLWAYPREFTSAADAGQVRAAPNRFLRLRGSSHLFLLLHGYAVFDNASMPIVGPQRSANDTFVEQVRMNARAAVAALTKEGCIDPQKIAVAGHSYGAFMTANLLAHSDLFCCGIARSGAYNRSLTPFGFQNEERTFWEAPEIYFAMSPFMHAQKINEPLLLVHGADDNNSGTFPIQSRRLFHAIKGHGGTARLCMLPFESHGYRSRECVLHCLAEMCDWLDAHCKGGGD